MSVSRRNTQNRSRIGGSRFAVALCAGLFGCADSAAVEIEPPTNLEDEGLEIVEGEWTTVLDDHPFPIDNVQWLVAGSSGRGTEEGPNFASRGEMTFLYANEEPVIRIEMRPFIQTDQPDDALEDLDRTFLWAMRSDVTNPESFGSDSDCTVDEWKNDCIITLYYYGEAQPQRLGAHFRIYLPADAESTLDILTEAAHASGP